MTRWEYCRRSAFAWNEMALLDRMGREGWELCGVWFIWLYFKRPRED